MPRLGPDGKYPGDGVHRDTAQLQPGLAEGQAQSPEQSIVLTGKMIFWGARSGKVPVFVCAGMIQSGMVPVSPLPICGNVRRSHRYPFKKTDPQSDHGGKETSPVSLPLMFLTRRIEKKL